MTVRIINADVMDGLAQLESESVHCVVTSPHVADRLKRNAILIELNPEYAAMAERRVKGDSPLFAEVASA